MNIFTKSLTRNVNRPAYAIRTLIQDSVSVKEKKIGIIGMGNVGTAVAKNLLKHNYKLTSITDIETKKCEGYPCKVGKTAREVVEE